MAERDLFANFERMRREMEQLFPPRRQVGFAPAVDVYYLRDPPRAVVRAELAGVDPDAVQVEVRGRDLILSGHRAAQREEERVYQQLEIENGPFRRAVALGADVDPDGADARYEDGILVIELPLVARRPRSVPIRAVER